MPAHSSWNALKLDYWAECSGRSRRGAPLLVHPVPSATPSQALLEGLVLDRLGAPPDYCAHPLGIASAVGTSTSLTLGLDPYLGRALYSFPEYCLASLLPSLSEPGCTDISGIPGLRVGGIDARRREIHLDLLAGRSGGPGSVSLVLPPRTTDTWTDILHRVAEHLGSQGAGQLWEDPGITAAEAEFLDMYPSLMANDVMAAATGSGLLRRVALFHTVTDFYRTRCWQDADSWKVDACVARTLPGSHDQLIQRLLHPRWGLPLHTAHQYCWCGDPYGPGQGGHTCSFYVENEADHHTLYLRVHTKQDGSDLTSRADVCRAVGAAPGWITRVFPQPNEEANVASG
ncbi:hypothetical protein ABT034_33095 [Streptomyces sp. NPDC002773]|uniref:hypothetical protein n=1 Tax=Streptomyces sp. NPDC002773 TaxID=3154430 RepID=UPI0033275496